MKRLMRILTLGGLFGFIAGLLFAPQKGEESRKTVSGWLDQGKEKLKEIQKDLSKGKEE